MTTKPSSLSSSETAAKLKSLIKEIPKNPHADASLLDELRRLLATLIQQGDLTFSNSPSHQSNSATGKWNSWLQKQHKRTLAQLSKRVVSGRRTAVRTMWGLIAASPHITASGHAHVHSDFLLEWLQAVVAMPLDVTSDKPMIHLLEAELSQRDVQYYALRCIARWAQEKFHKQQSKGKEGSDEEGEEEDTVSLQEQSDRMLHVLMMIPFPTTQSALQNSSNKYLFAPPKTSTKQGSDGAYEDQDDSDQESDSDSDDDSGVEDESDDDGPAKKKQKVDNSKNNKQFAYQDVKCHLGALSKAWQAILRLPLSTAALKKALPFLSTHVLPKLRRPLQFADLYMKAYSGAGGSDDDAAKRKHANSIIPLLALDGLFYLITEHQLEYPQFYTQLYALLRPKLFYVKYRTRFFALLQKCLLRNEMLPAHLVAAFLKRLLQGALQAPPGAALFVLALASNLLRQHEECAALIHRDTPELEDAYDPDTDDPVESKALQSSLWELGALERHYLPAVATLAQSIGREDPKSPMLQLDEMASHTYTSLIEQERKRRTKGSKRKHTYDKDAKPTTPVTFVKPTGLFQSGDVFEGILAVGSSSSDKE